MTNPADPRAQLQEEVARRLRPACPGIPDDEFRALVSRIVDVELSHRTPAGAVSGGDGASRSAAASA